jgi:hypothetical protein
VLSCLFTPDLASWLVQDNASQSQDQDATGAQLPAELVSSDFAFVPTAWLRRWTTGNSKELGPFRLAASVLALPGWLLPADMLRACALHCRG